MKIIVLTDNSASGYFQAEHGLSYFVEAPNFKFLFDTGHSDVFIKNAERGGLNLNESIDTIVLSHGHWDHGGGLDYLNGKRLLCHPGVFIERYRKGGMDNLGLNGGRDKFNRKYDLSEHKDPYEMYPGVFFLGEIPRLSDFEARTTSYVDSHGEPDFIPDDTGVAVVSEGKLNIISGCAHSGIVNMTEYARKITGVKDLGMVIGGFHLKYNDTRTQKTIQYFKKNTPDSLLPSHCTMLEALCAFHREFKISHVKTGNVINF
jgi:7,8-dihydropterin-6-yl-methyl-4-(beta-D-ribofuranosyl)aminobenzene 5'-phosphate synthase